MKVSKTVQDEALANNTWGGLGNGCLSSEGLDRGISLLREMQLHVKLTSAV